jgi:Adaptin N terminal region
VCVCLCVFVCVCLCACVCVCEGVAAAHARGRCQFVVGLALNALGSIGTADMSQQVARDVEKQLDSTNAFIRKKAALAYARCCCRRCPGVCGEHAHTAWPPVGAFGCATRRPTSRRRLCPRWCPSCLTGARRRHRAGSLSRASIHGCAGAARRRHHSVVYSAVTYLVDCLRLQVRGVCARARAHMRRVPSRPRARARPSPGESSPRLFPRRLSSSRLW